MNIRDLNIGSNRPDARRTGASDEARPVDGSERAGRSTNARGADRVPGDRVEISEAARAALAERTEAGPTSLGAAREALRSQPSSLDASRKAELQQRVADGYYQQDAVVEQVAERLAADLGAGAPGEAEGA